MTETPKKHGRFPIKNNQYRLTTYEDYELTKPIKTKEYLRLRDIIDEYKADRSAMYQIQKGNYRYTNKTHHKKTERFWKIKIEKIDNNLAKKLIQNKQSLIDDLRRALKLKNPDVKCVLDGDYVKIKLINSDLKL